MDAMTRQDHENMAPKLGALLDAYKSGGLTRERAVDVLNQVISAADSGDYDTLAACLRPWDLGRNGRCSDYRNGEPRF